MVKLTDEQKAMLEALENKPDEEIDYSDIPRITNWSGFRTGLFYRPKWTNITLILDENVIGWFESGLVNGQSLDESVNKAIRAQMYRIKFPVRVERAEKTILRVQESPAELDELTEDQIQEIEILYAMPVAEVASSGASLEPMSRPERKAGAQRHPVIRDITLTLDENIIDWFEYGLEEGESLDEVLNKALMDHIQWINSPRAEQPEEKAVQRTEKLV